MSKKLAQLKKAQEFAKSKGGKCLSTSYLGKYEKLEFECKNGHTRTGSYSYVVTKKSWYCKTCKEETKLS